jgi:hypothetical protein
MRILVCRLDYYYTSLSKSRPQLDQFWNLLVILLSRLPERPAKIGVFLANSSLHYQHTHTYPVLETCDFGVGVIEDHLLISHISSLPPPPLPMLDNREMAL